MLFQQTNFISITQGSNFIIAIVAMASNRGKMAIDKEKLCLKSKATFSPDEYLRKLHTCLANCIDFRLNLLYFPARLPDYVHPVVCTVYIIFFLCSS